MPGRAAGHDGAKHEKSPLDSGVGRTGRPCSRQQATIPNQRSPLAPVREKLCVRISVLYFTQTKSSPELGRAG